MIVFYLAIRCIELSERLTINILRSGNMDIGKFKVDALDGGFTQMDGGAIFGVVPKPLWEKQYAVNEKTSSSVSHASYSNSDRRL